jgi:hypothetical protein
LLLLLRTQVDFAWLISLTRQLCWAKWTEELRQSATFFDT